MFYFFKVWIFGESRCFFDFAIPFALQPERPGLMSGFKQVKTWETSGPTNKKKEPNRLKWIEERQ